MRIVVFTTALLLALSSHAATGGLPAHADEGEAEQTKTVYFAIKGMVTDNCPVLVKEAVRRIDGVERVRASLEDKTVEVDYIEGRTTPRAIRDVIEDRTGFDAEIKRVE